MRSRLLTLLIVTVLCVPITQDLPAQGKVAGYTVVGLGTLGGTVSGASSINNRSWVSGFSNLLGDTRTHATLWRAGSTPLDLGTLGGFDNDLNSAVIWPVKNDSGLIAGISETPALDPLGERWSCASFFPTATGHICLGFVWQDGVMTALPTLGGNNGYASGANNRGQVVGWAENTVHDPTCVAPQVLQFRAVLWGSKDGQVQELPPLPGDTSSAATAINDLGQVVGISGTCDRAVGRFSAAHAVLWQDGKPADIGNLGGVAWNTPTAINHRGQVVGFSDLPGDESGAPNFHAFLWTSSGGIRDLGTLPGDLLSLAFGINDLGQVVGQSIGAGGSRAFLWENGVMTDLNTIVPPGSLNLVYANDINASGEIAGGAFDQATGESPAFLAIPNR
jgi:probable HAF family extracellular repeat protein